MQIRGRNPKLLPVIKLLMMMTRLKRLLMMMTLRALTILRMRMKG